MTTPTPWWLNAGRRRFRGAASDPGDRPLGVCVLFLTAPDAVEDRVQRRSARVNLRQSTQKARSTSEGDRVGAQRRPPAKPREGWGSSRTNAGRRRRDYIDTAGVTGWIPVSPTQNPCNCWPSCSGCLLTARGTPQIVCKKPANALFTSRAIIERVESRMPWRETRGAGHLDQPYIRFRRCQRVREPGAPAALLVSQNLKDVGCRATGRARSCLGCFGRMSDAQHHLGVIGPSHEPLQPAAEGDQIHGLAQRATGQA